MKLSFCVFLLSFSISLSLNSQKRNYIKYYKLINKAEECFTVKKDKSCFTYFDKAFKENKPFLKDPFIAAQIAFFLNDTSAFYRYLKIGFENGMPITAINVSPIIKTKSTIEIINKINNIYTTHHSKKAVNEKDYDWICLKCYQSDSLKVKVGVESEFYQNEDETRRYILDSFLLQGKFPNEKLFGITTNKSLIDFYKKYNRTPVYPEGLTDDYFEEFELRLKCPFNIILHSKCFFTENKKLFYQAMINGYIHPKEFGILEETSIIWHQNTAEHPNESCEKAKYKICYNIFSKSPFEKEHIFDNTNNGLKIVEKNRLKIYMQKYSVDLSKKNLEKEIGIKFFFDFKDR